MKFVFALFAVALTAIACSKSSKDSAPLTPFQKMAGGQWLSECQKQNGPSYKETVVLNGATGTSSAQYFQNNDCTGAVTKTEGPVNFTYSAANKNGKDGDAKVTVTRQDGVTITVDIVIQGDTMVISGPDGSIIYHRQGGGQGKNNSPEMEAFDAAARGNWITRDCRQINGGSYHQVLTIKGGGQASTVYNVYADSQCQSNPTPQGNADITYRVDRFANGGGQLTVDGQTVDITINGAQMDFNLPNGAVVFLRIR